MRRVVVTGMGVVAPIGNNKFAVLRALKEGTSGIEFIVEMQELGLRCQVAGRIKGLETAQIGKRRLQTMADVARFAAVAALEAIEDAGVSHEALRNDRVAIVIGTAFGGIGEAAKAEQLFFRHKAPSRLGGTGIVKLMHSTIAGNLAAWLGIQGRAYAICSSGASGLDNLGHAYELIVRGTADVCLCGASEESTWRQVGVFLDNSGGMASRWNDQPSKACRPYDRDRAGAVFGEGAGVLLLEELSHAERRAAQSYAEVVGYGSANDGFQMFTPSGEGLEASIQQALATAQQKGIHQVDYINSHAAGTKIGDALEVRVLKKVFRSAPPLVSSTKGLNGHSLGAAGAQEAIFALLMLQHGFVAPTANLDNIAPECEGIRHVQSLTEFPLKTVMIVNSGLGGANACLIFRRL